LFLVGDRNMADQNSGIVTYSDDDIKDQASSAPVSYSDADLNPALPLPRKIKVPNVDAMGNPTGGEQEIELPAPRQYEDLPTVAMMNNVPSSVGFGLGLTSKPQDVENIIKNNMPEAKFGYDAYGNRTVEHEGKRYLIDKPGFNSLDFSRLVTNGVTAGILGGAAAAAAPVEAVGLPFALAAQGAAGGASSLFNQYLTNKAGGENPIDVSDIAWDAAASAAIPVVGKGLSSFYNLLKPNILYSLPRGTQNWIFDTAEKMRTGDLPIPDHPSDAILDNPRFKGAAKAIMSQDNAGSDVLENIIDQRAASTNQRVFNDINENLGPLSQSDRELAAELQAKKASLSSDLGAVFKGADPVDPSSVVNQIDNMLPTAKGDIRNALIKIRGMLVNKEGTPAIPATRVKPEGQSFYNVQEGTPAQPPVYETNPEALENARVAIDRMIKYGYGDNELNIRPGAFPAKDSAVSQIRGSLSNLLKQNVPGYEDVMGKYSNIYDMLDANEIGSNILKKGQNQYRPDQISAIMQNPDEARALQIGSRSAIETALKNSPDDVAALRKGLGGEGDYVRESLKAIHGPNSIENLINTADREAGYQKTANELKSARTSGLEKTGSQSVQDIETPVFGPHTISQQTAWRPINWLDRVVKGQTGDNFRQGLGTFIGAQGTDYENYLKSLAEAQARRSTATQLGTVAPILQPSVRKYLNTIGGGEPNESMPPQQNRGGRIERKHGGKVGHQHLVDRLMRLAERAKKEVNKGTEPLLNANDTAVAKALAVANKHI